MSLDFCVSFNLGNFIQSTVDIIILILNTASTSPYEYFLKIKLLFLLKIMKSNIKQLNSLIYYVKLEKHF